MSTFGRSNSLSLNTGAANSLLYVPFLSFTESSNRQFALRASDRPFGFVDRMVVQWSSDQYPDWAAQVRGNFRGKLSPALSPVDEEDKENKSRAQSVPVCAPMIEGFPESSSRIQSSV
jgi:hypothetical protein